MPSLVQCSVSANTGIQANIVLMLVLLCRRGPEFSRIGSVSSVCSNDHAVFFHQMALASVIYFYSPGGIWGIVGRNVCRPVVVLTRFMDCYQDQGTTTTTVCTQIVSLTRSNGEITQFDRFVNPIKFWFTCK